MKSLQYPGIRYQQVPDPKTRAALLDANSHLRALYELYNAGASTDHGPGLLRGIAPIVIPTVDGDPSQTSTQGVVGQLARTAPGHAFPNQIFMKTGNDGSDRDWVPLPTGATGFADPTGVVGLSVVPGVASTYMRSDAAPPLSQNIAPTWLQPHRWSNYVEFDEIAAPATPPANRIRLYAKDKGGISNPYFKCDDGSEIDLTGFGNVFGPGTPDRVPKWQSASVLTDSFFGDDGAFPFFTGTAVGFKASFDTSQMTRDNLYSMADPGSGGDYILSAGLIPQDAILLGSPTFGSVYFAGSLNWDGTTKQVIIGDGAAGGAPGIHFIASGGKNATITLAGAIITYDSTGGGGRHQFKQDVDISAVNVRTDTTTGTKIATGTGQKLGFWNTAPIVQPTTAFAAATMAGGGGTNITDTHTFDGYTLKQIVKILRSLGIAA